MRGNVRWKGYGFALLVLLQWLSLAAPPSNAQAQTWQFVVYGDTRNHDNRHREVLRAIVNHTPGYKFIFNVGDCVDHGDDASEWEIFQKACNEVLGGMGQDQIPPKYMAAPGNHDATETSKGLANWNHYLPGQVQQFGHEGKFFTFDYENARFVVMDSDKSSKTGPQLTMMMEAIQNNPQPWLFVITHRPIFEFGNYSYRDDLHDAWGIPLYQNGCDIIFNGHDHFYLRTQKLELDGNLNPPLDPDHGTVQIITANGGAPLRDINPNKDGNGYIVVTYKKDYGYTELTVTGDTLRLRHILRNGTVFDEEVYSPNPKPGTTALVDRKKRETIPAAIQLSQNYPNPFNPETTIRFSLPSNGHATLEVFGLSGERIETLVDGYRTAGTYRIVWDGRDSGGSPLTSGIYFYRLQAGAFAKTMKMIVVR